MTSLLRTYRRILPSSLIVFKSSPWYSLPIHLSQSQYSIFFYALSWHNYLCVTIEVPIKIHFCVILRGCIHPTMIIRLVGNLGYTVNLFFIDLVLLILALSLLNLSLFLAFFNFFDTKRSATTFFCSKFRLFYLASYIIDAIPLNLMNCYVIFKSWLFPSLLIRCKCEITVL